jgi:hypothetical protein
MGADVRWVRWKIGGRKLGKVHATVNSRFTLCGTRIELADMVDGFDGPPKTVCPKCVKVEQEERQYR